MSQTQTFKQIMSSLARLDAVSGEIKNRLARVEKNGAARPAAETTDLVPVRVSPRAAAASDGTDAIVAAVQTALSAALSPQMGIAQALPFLPALGAAVDNDLAKNGRLQAAILPAAIIGAGVLFGRFQR